jgi:hypothetical protein
MQLLKMSILRAEEILLELPAQLVALGCARPEGAAMTGRVNGAHGRVNGAHGRVPTDEFGKSSARPWW